MAESPPRSHRYAGAAVLGLLMLGAVIAVEITHEAVETRIAEQRQRQERALVGELMPHARDNDMATDKLQWRTRRYFDRPQALTVYRARAGGEPAGVVLMPIVIDGYNGPIRLAVGIDAGGRLTGVRVLDHDETRGFGAAIEPARSPWLSAFTGRSLDDPARPGWRLARDGGAFDGLSGATITARAVVRGLRSALVFFEDNRAALFRGVP